MTLFRFCLTIIIILLTRLNLSAQGFKEAKEFKIYTDLECGYGCRLVYDPAFRTCTINNKPIKCEYAKATLESKEKLLMYFGKDTANIKIHNLNGLLIESFYSTFAFVSLDTIGEYCSYFSNGKIKTKGAFTTFVSNEKGDVSYDMPLSLRHGQWLEYNDKGILIRKHKYNRGKIVD